MLVVERTKTNILVLFQFLCVSLNVFFYIFMQVSLYGQCMLFHHNIVKLVLQGDPFKCELTFKSTEISKGIQQCFIDKQMLVGTFEIDVYKSVESIKSQQQCHQIYRSYFLDLQQEYITCNSVLLNYFERRRANISKTSSGDLTFADTVFYKKEII